MATGLLAINPLNGEKLINLIQLMLLGLLMNNFFVL